ncbi:hypothetical protein KIF59_16045 [Enterobacter cloacae subsp. cloacae]|nr:hypothetical protein [Enterobacter cloacae subsp. cloacae]
MPAGGTPDLASAQQALDNMAKTGRDESNLRVRWMNRSLPGDRHRQALFEQGVTPQMQQAKLCWMVIASRLITSRHS